MTLTILAIEYFFTTFVEKTNIMKTFTFIFILAVSALFLQGQNMLRYNFNSTLNETNNLGPTLTVLGNPGIFVLDTLNEISGKTKTVYRFEANSGFQFNNAAAGHFQDSSYTIELYFKFDNLNSWKRVVDWKNRKSDNGAYVYNGQINFYDYAYSGQAPVVAGQYTYYVITRNKATKNLLMYTDAGVQINFTDTYGDGVMDTAQVLHFFFDDLMVPNEASSGAVALLNLYNYVLDSNQIKQDWIHINSEVFGVNEKGKTNTYLQAYPDPANENVTIDLAGFANDGVIRLSVLDLTGSRIFTKSLTSGNRLVIDLMSLHIPSGIYMVKAESDTKISTRKLMIRH